MICRASPAEGRLNVFQRVMLQWSELHPYNAIHTYQLAGPLNRPAPARAVEALAYNGLGIAEIDPDGVWYRHRCNDVRSAVEVELVAGHEAPEERLAAHLAHELNRPFERPRCRPFRFSVVEAGPGSHFVSMIYDHWVADSVGARLVMRHVLGRYLDLDIAENEEPLNLYPGTYREVFARRLQGHRLAPGVLRSLGGGLHQRQAWRVAYTSAAQMALGYAMYRLQPGAVRKIRQFARDNEASVNDVFLATLCRAMAPTCRSGSPGPVAAIGVGTIVDTRPDAEDELSESLGTFLGYYVVRVAGDQRSGLDELTRRVGATRVRKRRRSYLDAAVNLRVATRNLAAFEARKPSALRPPRVAHDGRRFQRPPARHLDQAAGRRAEFRFPPRRLQWTGSSAGGFADHHRPADERGGELSHDGVFAGQDRGDHAIVRGTIGDARRPRQDTHIATAALAAQARCRGAVCQGEHCGPRGRAVAGKLLIGPGKIRSQSPPAKLDFCPF